MCYESALSDLKLETLFKRREMLCLKFAKKCLKLHNFKNMFPLNKKYHCMIKRRGKKFVENYANTERYFKSTIPYMQKLLNKEDSKFENLLNDCNASSSSYASELCHYDSITDENVI